MKAQIILRELTSFSLFQKIVETMTSGKFTAPRNFEVNVAKVIGEMSLLEKTLYTLQRECEKKVEELPEDLIKEQDIARAQVLMNKRESYRNCLWISIKERLLSQDTKSEPCLAILPDFSIVIRHEEQSTEELQISDILSSIFSSLLEKPGDCNCPDKDLH